MTKNNILKRIKEYGLITLGCAIYSVAFCWWYQPNHLAFGGLTGVSQILHHFFPVLPIGSVTILMNVPLFLIGVRLIGKRSLASSVYAMALSYAMIDIINALYIFPESDHLLSAIFGGVLLGLSTGLMLLSGATTGGTELGARLLKFRLHHLSMGRLCLIIDVVVITAYALVFRSLNNALYGIISLYISSLVMDNVIYGSNTAKMAYIISDKSDGITSALLEADMGVTLLDAHGAYSCDNKQVILCAFKNQQLYFIKTMVRDIDRDAFIIVCEAHEVLGEGFNPNIPNSL